MSTYKSFAVAGGLTPGGAFSASLAGFVARALIAQPGISVKVLARGSAINTPASQEVAALGVSVEEADYDSPASLAEVLKGVEVVVSTLGGPGLMSQPALATAAKLAGVKLFVPSEFGNDTRGVSSDHPLARKMLFQGTLKEIGLPSAMFFNGPYADFIKTFMSVKDDQILITGDGTADISFTARADVSSFLAHVLTHLPPSQLANSVFLIEGCRTNYLALAAALQAKSPSLTVVHETREEALKKYKEGDFAEWLRVEWDKGNGAVAKTREELSNGSFPEWKPARVEEFL